MKIRCFCIVLIVSGALFSQVNNNRSFSGNNLLVANNLQRSK
ncbi:small toxic inner membrane protein TimP [Escherichia marmotae]|nr:MULTISPECIES: small toxic inner membrane protein TimP [Escherichia]MDZ5482859.1 small toxic inner membrane protein TimP [Escherichia marmotae]MEC9531431.1 small toxic inner membrane protein TimP [Escherichia marmotae]MEC9616343.1 small toxic inner membrane protein TimP [Escherichia marmotae]MEC9673874.1 small toxic inner membrane protein TimP [Escherichia marmotae]MEC9682085.1 small toxic inner membrane protein TimP [Escherichia marmotae]